jgi:hypothetical protein
LENHDLPNRKVTVIAFHMGKTRSRMMNPIEARAALDSIDDVQRQLALQGTQYPLWRHAAFAAVMAALVLGQGFALPIQMALFVPAMAGLAWILADDRRRYGPDAAGDAGAGRGDAGSNGG